MSEAWRSRAGWIALAFVLGALPLYLDAFWLQTGLFAMAAAVGAIGLTLLVGTAGQLSLGHAFFLAVGAYGYCLLAGHDAMPGDPSRAGAGLPPLAAALGAVAAAAAAGAVVSPLAGRLRGIYLGIASLGLVFIGQHVLFNASGVTGGFNGHDAAPFRVLGLSFDDAGSFAVLGVEFGELERLWYLGLTLVAVACWFARNVVRGRPGRALESIRDGEVAASALGVNVARYRQGAFVLSSAYAGLAGVLLALVSSRVVPQAFGFGQSVDYVVMIVLGGLGSVGGAALGAVFVTALPSVLTHYADSLPLLAEPGTDGLAPAHAARLLYGAAVIAVLLRAPRGLAGLLSEIELRGRTT